MGTFLSPGSHQRVLMHAVQSTRGPVVECGAGYFSTPLLHGLCCPGRSLISLETDPSWAALFKGFERDGHEIWMVESTLESWLATAKKVVKAYGRLSVAFIDQDNDSMANRIATANYFMDHADVVICHDISRRYGSAPPRMMETRYRRLFSGIGIDLGTLVASNNTKLNRWPEMNG